MNIVITTGCPHSGWESALPTLRQLGLKEAGDSFANWYDDLFQKAGITDLFQIDQLLESDHGLAEKAMALLSAESDAPLLWADSRNLWLLDFWATAFPQSRFLLLYSRSENALAYALRQGVDPERFMKAWLSTNRQLMRFQRRIRSRSLLLDAEAITQHPEALADAGQCIGLVLQPTNPSPTFATAAPPLERLLASQFVREQPAIQALQMELEASARPLGETTAHAPPLPTELYPDYRRWNVQIEQLSQERDEQLRLATDRQTQLTEARQAQERLEAANKEAEQENELLLLQLHQVQEELEHYFLKYQELTQESEDEQEPAKPPKTTPFLRVLAKPFRRKSKAQKRQKRQLFLINKSGFFDEAWYLAEYPDVAEAGIDAVAHYLRYGAAEGRDPSPQFDTAFYLATNPDVADAEINPLVHYARFGREEGRQPSRQAYTV